LASGSDQGHQRAPFSQVAHAIMEYAMAFGKPSPVERIWQNYSLEYSAYICSNMAHIFAQIWHLAKRVCHGIWQALACRANMAHIRQSKPEFGLGIKVPQTCHVSRPERLLGCSLVARNRRRRYLSLFSLLPSSLEFSDTKVYAP